MVLNVILSLINDIDRLNHGIIIGWGQGPDAAALPSLPPTTPPLSRAGPRALAGPPASNQPNNGMN